MTICGNCVARKDLYRRALSREIIPRVVAVRRARVVHQEAMASLDAQGDVSQIFQGHVALPDDRTGAATRLC